MLLITNIMCRSGKMRWFGSMFGYGKMTIATEIRRTVMADRQMIGQQSKGYAEVRRRVGNPEQMTRPLRRTSVVGPALTATMLTVAGSICRTRAFFQLDTAASAIRPWGVVGRRSSSKPAFSVLAGGSSASTLTCATRIFVAPNVVGSRREASSRRGGKASAAVNMVKVGQDDRWQHGRETAGDARTVQSVYAGRWT